MLKSLFTFIMQAGFASRWIEDNKLKVIASNWLSTETKVHAVERYDHTQRNVSASFDFILNVSVRTFKFSRAIHTFLRLFHLTIVSIFLKQLELQTLRFFTVPCRSIWLTHQDFCPGVDLNRYDHYSLKFKIIVFSFSFLQGYL